MSFIASASAAPAGGGDDDDDNVIIFALCGSCPSFPHPHYPWPLKDYILYIKEARASLE